MEEDWYDLVVLGAGGRRWLENRLLGSVSTYVLHSSPWSVLIVHEASEGEHGRVLIGTDGSRGADFTVATLARWADPARTKTRVVSVVPSNSPLLFTGPPSYIPPEAHQQNDEVLKLIRNRGQRSADRAAALLTDAGFDVDVHISSGNPTEQLLKEAEDGQFDLVAVGSRGQGPIRRALLGSVSDQLVRHSCAALIGRRLAS